MARVYAAAEALFAQLEAELKKYQDWVVLGQPIQVRVSGHWGGLACAMLER